MKSVYPAARVLVQLILCGPVFTFFPWAVLMGLGAIYFTFTGESHGLSKGIGYGFGWLGLLGLAATIVLPASFFVKRKWALWLATLLIACGYLATAAIVAGLATPDSPLTLTQLSWFVWLFGGPVLVGVWNLVRIWKRPIQPPQRNAGSRPSSDDSPASETPASLGPRG